VNAQRERIEGDVAGPSGLKRDRGSQKGKQKEQPMSLPYKHDLIPRARELRKEMTPQERRLWYVYLSKQMPRFQRQKVISGFIVDFYCHAARLVVEVDGTQHRQEQGLAYDAERDAVLKANGLTVLRFDNHEIDMNFSGVCYTIDEFIRNCGNPLSSPS